MVGALFLRYNFIQQRFKACHINFFMQIYFQDEQLLQIVESAYNEAFDILYSEDGWKEEKKNDEGDVVVSRKSAKGNNMGNIPQALNNWANQG